MRHRLDRALEILRLVQSGVASDPHAITSKLNVNRRTFYRDIAFLKELGVEISFDHGEGRYRIEGLTGANPGDNSERFQQVIGQALRQSSESSTVVSIVRHAAAILTGETDFADRSSESTTASTEGLPSEPSRRNCSPGQDRQLTPGSSGWVDSRTNLGALVDAMDHRRRILVISSELGGSAHEGRHVLIRQITINNDEVIIEGIDLNGRLVRTASSSISRDDDGVLKSRTAEAVGKL
ncbi:HTH domain-containing protein [Roseiconus lacunae]|uniref:HTH domain-containing protein n=1 Tax=Roseiconus lacunae TaxID=2605694 RepID=UPI0030876475|nr:HTH domain-containing protein [Stieleria sp. HD01]